MLDDALRLLESVLKLRDERQESRDRYFEHYVQPTYVAAEQVFRDYRALLADIQQKVESGETRENLIRFMEERRMQELPVRMRLRAILSQRDRESTVFDQRTGIIVRRGRFERGIWGLLLGGLGHFEEKEVFNWWNPYSRDRHTLLSILYEMQRTDDNQVLLSRTWRQTEALDRAWQDVTLGFAELQARTYPAP